MAARKLADNSSGSSWSDNKFNINGTQPTTQYPLGNPPFADTNNTQGGPNYLRYLTDVYNTTSTLLYDLAVGGATIDQSLVKSGVTSKDLLYQVHQSFMPKYSSLKDKLWTSDNALFNIWMCDNDVHIGLNNTNPDKLVSDLMYQYWDVAVADLYNAGARKFFFVNTPAQDRSPLIAVEEPKADIPKYLTLKWKFDDALKAKIDEFQSNHTDVGFLSRLCVWSLMLTPS